MDIAIQNIATRREFECRLAPDRALETLEEANGFLAERGLLTLAPDCALPSLFGACHEEPYSDAPARGVVYEVRAAVLAPGRESLRWFSWLVPREALDDERLSRPEPGWVAAK